MRLVTLGASRYGLAGYGGSGEYTGPLYPRVEHHGDGTATLRWNELQAVRGPLSAMPEPGPDETFPREMPGIAEHPPGAITPARSLYVPMANGQPLQWYLHPNAPDGIILTPDGWVQYLEEGLIDPRWAPVADAGPDPRPPDWMRGFPTIIPTTGEPGPRFDRRGGWEDGEWFVQDEAGFWNPIPASSRPFQGGPGCFAWIAGTLQQFDCEQWPDGTQFGPGEGPYVGKNPADPYYPYLDPSSPWFGWPVLALPPAPYGGEVPEPCPPGYTRDPENFLSDCFPIPGEVPPYLPECPEGYVQDEPGGPCYRITPGTPGEPDPGGPPELVPCFDAATGRTGWVDPITGVCVTDGTTPGEPGTPGAPGAGPAWLLPAAVGGLLLLAGRRRR